MNFEDNEQNGRNRSLPNESNPLANDNEGRLDENDGTQEDWSHEDALQADERVENGVAERYDKDEVGNSEYDKDEGNAGYIHSENASQQKDTDSLDEH